MTLVIRPRTPADYPRLVEMEQQEAERPSRNRWSGCRPAASVSCPTRSCSRPRRSGQDLRSGVTLPSCWAD